MGIKKEKFKVTDMTCSSCEKRIENELMKLSGVKKVIASNSEASVNVEYDGEACSEVSIKAAIEKAGYTVSSGFEYYKLIGILLIGAVILFLGNYQGSFNMSDKVKTGTTYLVLFVVGIFTSIHCVGMCGGIMLSQSISKDGSSKWRSLKPTLLYNAGRVISYTILGGIVGGIGSVLSISLQFKAGIAIFAGLFMVIMGFNMAGFGIFKRFNIKMPWSFCSIKSKSRAPIIVGFLNGFLPCGPLQTMQLYALGTGSILKGALSMFVFAIGTVPLMLTFGMLTGFMSRSFTKSILKFSGILVLILGLVMANRGLALAGVKPISLQNLLNNFGGTAKPISASSSSKAIVQDGVQILHMTADTNGYTPNVLFIQKGIPVKWIIDGAQVTSCNGQIVVPSLNIQKTLTSGQNIVEFTPNGTSDINFSCWMGMINGVIKVVDNLGNYDTSKSQVVAPSSNSMSCCSGTGASSAPTTPSIFGNDITKVASARLVKIAEFSGNTQQITIKGINSEFDPPIIVVKSKALLHLHYDMRKYNAPDGEYAVLDLVKNKKLMAVQETKDDFILNYKFTKPGSYAILKDNQVVNAIKVVDNLNNVDVNKVRSEFLE